VLAERFAARELALLPGSLRLWRTWCESLRRLGRSSEALLHCEAIARLVPDPGILDLAALVRVELHRGPDPVQAFLTREPRSEELPFRMERMLLELERGTAAPGEALALWERLAALQRPDAALALRLAGLLARDDVSLALRILEDALAESPESLQRAALDSARHLLAGAG
jgi:hypothetical protein